MKTEMKILIALSAAVLLLAFSMPSEAAPMDESAHHPRNLCKPTLDEMDELVKDISFARLNLSNAEAAYYNHLVDTEYTSKGTDRVLNRLFKAHFRLHEFERLFSNNFEWYQETCLETEVD